jgi:hypothetical protein
MSLSPATQEAKIGLWFKDSLGKVSKTLSQNKMGIMAGACGLSY